MAQGGRRFLDPGQTFGQFVQTENSLTCVKVRRAGSGEITDMKAQCSSGRQGANDPFAT
jgi:hypothetical protein